MGSLIAFIGGQLAGANLARRLRLIDINLPGNRFSVGFAGQRLPRHLDEVRIAKVFRTVGIGVLFSFGHHLHGVGAAEAVLMHIEVFEDIQDLHDMNAPGRWGRHGEHLIAAILAAHRRTFNRVVIRQIRFGD